MSHMFDSGGASNSSYFCVYPNPSPLTAHAYMLPLEVYRKFTFSVVTSQDTKLNTLSFSLHTPHPT